MPLDTADGEYDPRDVATVRDAIYDELQTRLDTDPETLESSVLRAYVDSVATTLVEQQEQGLASVHDAAFLDSAEGSDLEAVVDLVAAKRREAITATGVQTFSTDGRVSQDYSIPQGNTVQTTDGSVVFETTEARTLTLYDDFEGATPLANYSGDTGGFTIESGRLKGAASSTGAIAKDGSVFRRGDEMRATVEGVSGGAGPDEAWTNYLVGSASATDRYAVVVDFTDDELQMWSPSAQQVSTSVSGGIPSDTKLDVHVDTRTNGDHYARLYDGETELASLSWAEPNPKRFEGQVGFQQANGEVFFDDVAHHRVAVNTEATSAGSDGNVGANTLTVMSNPPAGVSSTSNPYPTGDTNQRDTDGVALVAGTDEESDDELRERVRDAGTDRQHPVLREVSELESVTSASIVTNASDSTDTDGRPAKSFEVVVPTSADFIDVAEAIFAEKAFTSNDVGGYAGTLVSETVTAFNGQQFDVDFSSATVTDIDMTLDIVVNDAYDGDEALRRRVVEYIGGTRPDGTKAVGTGVGENVYVDQITDAVTDDDGVVGFDNANTSFTPSTTTDSNGLTIIDVADTNIGEVDGRDGSIKINKTTL